MSWDVVTVMYHMIADAISKTFSKHVGKNQARALTPKALVVSFSQRLDYNKEDGYRQMDLVLYAPYNYVQVWTRTRWTVINQEDLIDDGEGDTYVAPGKDYTVGASDWTCIGDHDSGWRGAVEEFLRQNQSEILGFENSNLDDWYSIVEISTLGIPGTAR